MGNLPGSSSGLGWNMSYPFNTGDLLCCGQCASNYLDANAKVLLLLLLCFFWFRVVLLRVCGGGRVVVCWWGSVGARSAAAAAKSLSLKTHHTTPHPTTHP